MNDPSQTKPKNIVNLTSTKEEIIAAAEHHFFCGIKKRPIRREQFQGMLDMIAANLIQNRKPLNLSSDMIESLYLLTLSQSKGISLHHELGINIDNKGTRQSKFHVDADCVLAEYIMLNKLVDKRKVKNDALVMISSFYGVSEDATEKKIKEERKSFRNQRAVWLINYALNKESHYNFTLLYDGSLLKNIFTRVDDLNLWSDINDVRSRLEDYKRSKAYN